VGSFIRPWKRLLFLVAHREPVLDQDDSGTHQHALELRTAVHELQILGFAAKSHDAFHARAVVPTAVEQDHLSRGRQVGDIALEIPLRLFAFGWGAQGHYAADAWIQFLSDTFDGAAIAGSIAPFKQNHYL
jgi:hypothetical protein